MRSGYGPVMASCTCGSKFPCFAQHVKFIYTESIYYFLNTDCSTEAVSSLISKHSCSSWWTYVFRLMYVHTCDNKDTKILHGICRFSVERLHVNVHIQLWVLETLFENGGLNNVEREENIKLEHFETKVYTAVVLASDAFIEHRYWKQLWGSIKTICETLSNGISLGSTRR